ncbi:hypothetical protein ILUMI_10358 [Ignelater luminosus]|uniref:Uncharacterized protein n=1 Tax=Ignelater luminosus TaxID=2038154 RepID=A0A8K0D2K9_IGNLU|nr:hypothetical protein ILUMI_10358 [Ignelater luminosus]
MTEEIESVPALTSKLVDYVCDSDDSTKDPDFVISESDNSDHDEVLASKHVFPQERRIYISSNVSMYNMKRRRGRENSFRTKTFKYFLKNEDGEKLEVCKSFFLTTLGYNPKNDRVITNIMFKRADNILPSTDRRGKHSKTPKTDRVLIKNHVESFSPTNKKYLPSDLTIRSMHADFISVNPNIKCSYELYKKCVSKDLNISFTKLGHEECEVCETFNLHDSNHTKTSLSEDCTYCDLWNQHIKKAAESCENYKSVAEESFPENTVCFSADLEKVIMLPRVDMFKREVFCQRIIVFNESFVPVDETFELNFLRMKFLGSVKHSLTISHFPGISEQRKQQISKNLMPLIPENRRQFWENFPTSNNSVDLRIEYDD